MALPLPPIEPFLEIRYQKPVRPMVIISEPDLVAGLQAGEHPAISALYDNYSAALYGIIFRIVKIDEIAEDILQDTFVKAWKSIGSYDPAKGRLFTWLAHMARNLAIDQLRTKYHRNTQHHERLEDCPTLEIVHNLQKNTDLIGIRALTIGLPPEHRSIVDLVYFQGYTHLEAAEELGIPAGTLKTRLRLAIRWLRKRFNEHQTL